MRGTLSPGLRRSARPAALDLVVLALIVGLAGCRQDDGVAGVVGGPVAATTLPAGAAGSTTTSAAPMTTGPLSSGVPASSPTTAATAPAATAPPGRLRLGGGDLGVTRLGNSFREAVAAVAAVLGPPLGDPAPDTACIGAEDETSWGSFRLGSSGGRLSGWLSTSKTLSTPTDVTVGTTVPALRQAYGDRLQVRPPAPDAGTVFVVAGAGLGGSLTGPGSSDTVTSIFNGTCETP